MDYRVKASVTVDIVMSIEAGSEDEAERIFKDSVICNAELIDVDRTKWDALEDSISEFGPISTEPHMRDVA